jgi:hypothetical protein
MYKTQKQKNFNRQWLGLIVFTFTALCILKSISTHIEDTRAEACRYLPYTEINFTLYCVTSQNPVIKEKMTDIEEERKKLFELAQSGNKHAKAKLNKLNYDEQLRKQKHNRR